MFSSGCFRGKFVDSVLDHSQGAVVFVNSVNRSIQSGVPSATFALLSNISVHRSSNGIILGVALDCSTTGLVVGKSGTTGVLGAFLTATAAVR